MPCRKGDFCAFAREPWIDARICEDDVEVAEAIIAGEIDECIFVGGGNDLLITNVGEVFGICSCCHCACRDQNREGI